MSDCGCKIEVTNFQQGRTLKILLCINAFMFFIEISLGILSESTALIADSLDMLADAAVYGISLYAVGKASNVKINAASLSGVFQVILGLLVMMDAIRRLIYGSDPVSFLMITVGISALIANVICLVLISKHREGEVHMRASWIFSKNDVIANLGIIFSGGLVYLFNTRYPDLVIGIIISFIVIRGGVKIITNAAAERALTGKTNRTHT